MHPFRPRLLDAVKDYSRARLGADLGAGVMVGVVALPLAMAFAIASGVKPEQGLITAVIGGFLISLLGGSHVQIGGPAGAFIVVVYGIVHRSGLSHLLICTALAGIVLFAMGALRLGGLVRYMPVSIIIGFTNGIAVLIALSQLKDLLGLQIPSMPAHFFGQIATLGSNLGSFNPIALALGSACVLLLVVWPRLFGAGSPLPAAMLEGRTVRTAARIPGPVVALVLLTLFSHVLQLPVDTIGSRFGSIPQGLPTVGLPSLSWSSSHQIVMDTLTIALLGAVESLLCARVADNFTELPRHDPNQELMAQGVANCVVPFFGGIPATGTIARTVTNIRGGATSPVAGIVHALTLMVIVLVAAPLAEHVPMPVLAGILMFVAWNMGEWHEFTRLRRFSVPYRAILVGTFLLTVIFDLTVAVEVGLVLACIFFIYRMSTLFRVEATQHPHAPGGVQVFRLYGSLFFGAVAKLESVTRDLHPGTRTVVLEMQQLISLDTSGIDALQQLHRALHRQGVALVLCAPNEQPRSLICRAGLDAALGDAGLYPTLDDALAAQHSLKLVHPVSSQARA